MKFKVNELQGDLLDAAAALASGYTAAGTKKEYGYIRWRTSDNEVLHYEFSPTRNANEIVRIVEQEGISSRKNQAGLVAAEHLWDAMSFDGTIFLCGPTFCVAVLRCFVASKLGYEISIPKSILNDLEIPL